MQAQSSPSTTPTPSAAGQPAVATVRAPSASQIYDGLQAQRQELAQQLENLERKREELVGQLQGSPPVGTERGGLEQRIAAIDQRITALDKQIADAEASVARAAATPGAVVEHVEPERPVLPEGAYVLGGIFMFIVLLPLTIAYARRIWRRGAAVVTSLPKELTAQLSRLEQAMEAMSIEVERIGEGQRFMAKVLSENGVPRALGEGAAEPIPVKARETQSERHR